MTRSHLPILLLAGLLSGCGGFSSGGAPGLEPPRPPEFASPERQGSVSGQVVVANGFMPALARHLTRDEEDEELASATDVFSTMTAHLHGKRRNRIAEVGGDGSFEAEELPDGLYAVELRSRGRTLAVFHVPVQGKRTTDVRLEILGHDLADLDGDGSREDLALRLEIRLGLGGARVVRVLLPDGSVRARLPDGGIDYLLPGGVVRRERPGRGATFRRDHDLDGVLDEDDPDYRRLRHKPPPVSEDDMLLGRAFPPLIRQAGAHAPHTDDPPGDLALFTAELVQDFGGVPSRVTATLHGRGGAEHRFELRDDGGEQDLLPDWPGHQPSGDEVAGDGIYSYLVPVDSTTRPLIYNRQVVVEAVDAEGRRSNRPSFFLHRSTSSTGTPPAATARTPPPWEAVRDIEFLGRLAPEGPEVEARFQADPSLSGMVATLVGPAGFKRVFAPGDGLGPEGWIPFRTRLAPLSGDGTYYIVLGIPGELIFFAGRVLDAETSFSARTGG